MIHYLTESTDVNDYRKRGVLGGLVSMANRLEQIGFPEEAAVLRRWVNTTLREAMGLESQNTGR